MAVYYKFKSAKDYDLIWFDGPIISVLNLKQRIFESKRMEKGTDFDLVITNAQTNEEYLDGGMIPENTSVLVRRIPGLPRMPIIARPDKPKVETKLEDDEGTKSTLTTTDSSALKDLESSECNDGFGEDLFAIIPEVMPAQPNNLVKEAPRQSEAGEDDKIKVLVESSALDWHIQSSNGFGRGRDFGGAGRMGGRGFGRGFEQKTPPPRYVCHRCSVPGHFIQHCPTNGDPNYDIKKLRPATGVPKSMLVPTPDGSYSLPNGVAAVVKPNEAVFEKEMEGLISTRSVGDLPPELHCPLCKQVMKDAAFTSKCCFKSFCDTCIRDYVISKLMCVCGARDILADDLLPNKTLRDTINRILESGTSSSENARSRSQVEDMESARDAIPKVPSPKQSAASKEEQMPPPCEEEAASKPNDTVEEIRPVDPRQSQLKSSEKMGIEKVSDVSEATNKATSVKQPASLEDDPLAKKEVHLKVATGDSGKKKKRKKDLTAVNGVNDQWMPPQVFGMENYMMPIGSPAYDVYWTRMYPEMNGFNGSFPSMMTYNSIGYGLGTMDLASGVGVIAQHPFGSQAIMYPSMVPQRDLASEFGMGGNFRPSPTTREEFDAPKADSRKKCGESKEISEDREYSREANGVADLKLKPRSVQKSTSDRPPSNDLSYHRHSDRYRNDHREIHRQRRCSQDLRLKPSIAAMSAATKRYQDTLAKVGLGYGLSNDDDDDERHFKRKRARY